MLADLELVAGLPADQVGRIADTLSRESGFLDTVVLRNRIHAVVEDAKTAQAVLRALQNFEPGDVDRILESADRHRKGVTDTKLDDAKMADLRRNLSILVQAYPALDRFEKAQRLATLTGQRLDSADLICDLRPIFDGSGEHIEGILPYTRLRLVATGADGLPRDFEAELSVAQVHDLFESVKKAKT